MDVTIHYSGCLRASERAAYLASLPLHSQRRIKEEEWRVERTRSQFKVDPESKVGERFASFAKVLQKWRSQHVRFSSLDRPNYGGAHLQEESRGSVDAEIEASVIYYENGAQSSAPGLDGDFPYQKISVQRLLESKDSPLIKSCLSGTVRYFHLPANNMSWLVLPNL